MNKNFITGFIKAAQTWGFTAQQASALLKEAGRGQMLMQGLAGATRLAGRAPAVAMDAAKGVLSSTKPALNKITDTANTLKSMVAPSGVAPRAPIAPGTSAVPAASGIGGAKAPLAGGPVNPVNPVNPAMANRGTPMHQQADYLRMLRGRMKKFNGAFGAGIQ
jgi:hypothetical protein